MSSGSATTTRPTTSSARAGTSNVACCRGRSPGISTGGCCSTGPRPSYSGTDAMTAKIIDGTAIAAALREEVAGAVRELVDRRGVKPGLAVVLVGDDRSEEHTSELQSLMRISYAVFCSKKNKTQ